MSTAAGILAAPGVPLRNIAAMPGAFIIILSHTASYYRWHCRDIVGCKPRTDNLFTRNHNTVSRAGEPVRRRGCTTCGDEQRRAHPGGPYCSRGTHPVETGTNRPYCAPPWGPREHQGHFQCNDHHAIVHCLARFALPSFIRARKVFDGLNTE